MKTKYSIEQAYGDVALFNELAGNLKDVTYDSIDNQISFIFEELSETITAMEEMDKVELLDGACDLFVTVAGLMQKLDAKGYNVAEALNRVNENNLAKFPSELVGSDLYPAGYTFNCNESHGRWVIKNANGKIMKPNGFVPVDLSDLVPEGSINE